MEICIIYGLVQDTVEVVKSRKNEIDKCNRLHNESL